MKASRCAASSLFADATSALGRIPVIRDWLEAAGLFALFVGLAAFIALPAGLITMPVRVDWAGLWPVALVVFFVPALGA
ncbi:hypothetical protein [Hyphobacterium marinum]|uniref:hypothetical protein n=1 Tax=Hyphobacterium marinum TaxID=3116574 RepID=UPI002E808C34|nr:hypothetical protein [Hyphobacterium sp. Y6023]